MSDAGYSLDLNALNALPDGQRVYSAPARVAGKGAPPDGWRMLTDDELAANPGGRIPFGCLFLTEQTVLWREGDTIHVTTGPNISVFCPPGMTLEEFARQQSANRERAEANESAERERRRANRDARKRRIEQSQSVAAGG